METFKFTKSKLESLPPADSGQVEYGDTVVNGLRVRVGVSGVKSFCISRKRNGKFIRATLGRFPDLTIDNARQRLSNCWGTLQPLVKIPTWKDASTKRRQLPLPTHWIPTSRAATQD